MAIMDKELDFATAHAPTTGSNISTNVYQNTPLGGSPTANANRDLGAGEPLFLNILVLVAPTSAGSGASVEFKLMTHTTATITSGVVLITTGAIAQASLPIKTKITIPLPRGSYKDYTGVVATISGENLTAGTFAYWVDKSPQDKRSYAGNYTVA